MKISVFNVKYSDNLGDGIIAECLESSLKQFIPSCELTTIDLTGRDAFGSSGTLSSSVKKGGMRSFLMKIYEKLPAKFKQVIFTQASQQIIKKTQCPNWLDKINQSDVIIIGGGQLFCNHMLYFPLRLHALATVLKQTNKPIAIYGVGVDKSFSAKASKLLSTITEGKNIFFISVRDDDSKVSWENHFNSTAEFVTRDPGLLAYDVYAEHIKIKQSITDIKTIGINLMMDSTAVLNQSEPKLIPLNEDLFYETGVLLASQGHKVVYFTNGLPVDESIKLRIKKKFERDSKYKHLDISFLVRLTTPTQLAVTISKLDLLIAHRLHANILAYSMMIPHVGIGWSIKMNSFFDAVERKKYFVPADKNLNAEALVNTALRTLEEGIDENVHKNVVTEARLGVEHLCSAIMN